MTANSNNNNDYNERDDLDRLKEQILSDQEKDIEKQKQSHTINYDNIVIDDGRDLKSKILNWGFADFVIKTIKKTVKREDSLIRQLFYTGLSTYSNRPINIGIKAPTSEGKTYVVKEVIMKFFPKKDVWVIGSMSPKVIIRQNGKLVDSNTNELLESKIRELKKQISSTKDAETKENLQEQLEQLLDNSKIVIDSY